MFNARRFRGLMWVGLLPGALVLGLSVPSVEGFPIGVGEALGCSGGPSVVPQLWRSLGPAFVRASTGAVPVATDGFFVISAMGDDLSLEVAQAQLRVVVTDEGGEEVPGDVSVLRSDASNTHLFGWVAREPLAVGARLTAALATDPPTEGGSPVGGQYALHVEGAPTSAPTPQASFSRWGTVYSGTGEGELVSCRATECGPSRVLTMPPRVVEQVAAYAAWTAPEIVGNVAWRLRAEPVSPEGDAAGEWRLLFFGNLEEYREHFDAETGGVPLFELNRVDFRERAESYCGSVILEDLRTGVEQRSELCSAPGALEQFGSTTGIERCYQPPSAELTPVWCELRRDARDFAVCDPYLDVPPLPTDPASASGDAGTLSSRDGSSPSSFGCALGATRSGPPASAILTVLALTSLARRWGRRRLAR